MVRPAGYEQNRHPTWEIVDMLEGKLGGQLVTDAFDYIKLNFTGADLTSVNFKTGGALGTTVATLTLAYVAGKLDSVTKT